MGAGGGERAPVALCREPTDAAAETRGWAAPVPSKPAGETGGGPHPVRLPFYAESGNKKKGRSIVYSPSGWYDNAPSLLRRGCAALKAVELRSTPRKLFVKSLTKNFSFWLLWPRRSGAFLVEGVVALAAGPAFGGGQFAHPRAQQEGQPHGKAGVQRAVGRGKA